MKEVISINVGQAGVQLSNAAWELFCIEHGIRCDGSRIDSNDDPDERCEIFYQPLSTKYVPRVISVDFEPSVIDEIRLGPYRLLFHPDQLISGCEDCASNFARGNFTIGKIYMKTVMRQVVKLVENCDGLQGFFLLNSFDGGTGSGFSSCLEEALSLHYGKTPKFQIGIYPSRRMATNIVYPYNAIFHTHATMDHTDLSILMDNEAIYNICCNQLRLLRPSYNNINKIIAQLFSSVTVSMRFKNFLNSDMDQIRTNLIPYPKIHFPLSHFSPFLGMDKVDKEPCNISDITRDIFDPNNQLVQCDTSNGRFMACVLQFRGSVSPNEVNKAIHEIKGRTNIQFVDWCPTGFKIGINSKPLANAPGSHLAQIQKSLTMLSNTTAIVETWSDLLRKFNILYSQKAFIHWFIGEGLEEGEFTEAYDNIKSLERDYFEASLPSNDTSINQRDYQKSVKSSLLDDERTSKTNKSKVVDNKKRASKVSKNSSKDNKQNAKSRHSSKVTTTDIENSSSDDDNFENVGNRNKKKSHKNSKSFKKTERNSKLDGTNKSLSKLISKSKSDLLRTSMKHILNKIPSVTENFEKNNKDQMFSRKDLINSGRDLNELNDVDLFRDNTIKKNKDSKVSAMRYNTQKQDGSTFDKQYINGENKSSRKATQFRQSSVKPSNSKIISNNQDILRNIVHESSKESNNDHTSLVKDSKNERQFRLFDHEIMRQSAKIHQSFTKPSIITLDGSKYNEDIVNKVQESIKQTMPFRQSSMKSLNSKFELNQETKQTKVYNQNIKHSNYDHQSSVKNSTFNQVGSKYDKQSINMVQETMKEGTELRPSSKKAIDSKSGLNQEENLVNVINESVKLSEYPSQSLLKESTFNYIASKYDEPTITNVQETIRRTTQSPQSSIKPQYSNFGLNQEGISESVKRSNYDNKVSPNPSKFSQVDSKYENKSINIKPKSILQGIQSHQSVTKAGKDSRMELNEDNHQINGLEKSYKDNNFEKNSLLNTSINTKGKYETQQLLTKPSVDILNEITKDYQPDTIIHINTKENDQLLASITNDSFGLSTEINDENPFTKISKESYKDQVTSINKRTIDSEYKLSKKNSQGNKKEISIDDQSLMNTSTYSQDVQVMLENQINKDNLPENYYNRKLSTKRSTHDQLGSKNENESLKILSKHDKIDSEYEKQSNVEPESTMKNNTFSQNLNDLSANSKFTFKDDNVRESPYNNIEESNFGHQSSMKSSKYSSNNIRRNSDNRFLNKEISRKLSSELRRISKLEVELPITSEIETGSNPKYFTAHSTSVENEKNKPSSIKKKDSENNII